MKTIRILIISLAVCWSTTVFSQNVYTTKTGEKYHKSNCRYLKYSKFEVKLERAIKLGYDPCSVCKPPTKVTKSKGTASSLSNSNSSNAKPKNNRVTKKAVATQCTGKTKAGKRCKRRTKNANGRCYQH